MRGSLAENECDLPTEEGSRRAGSIAWQPDHLTIRATLLKKPNLDDRSILITKCVSRWLLQQRGGSNIRTANQVPESWGGCIPLISEFTNMPPGGIASYVIQAQDKVRINHLPCSEASGATLWTGGSTVCTAPCWLTRPEGSCHLLGIHLKATNITLSHIRRFQGSQSSRDLRRSWCIRNHPL